MTTTRPMRARRWTFTLNTPTEAEITTIDQLPENTIKYLIYGTEVAPTTGTVHLQGYVELTSLKSMAQMKKLISSRAHLEKARGTGQQNKTYCSKDGEVKERGSLSHQGERKDITSIQKMIEDGCSDLEIAQAHFGQWTRMRTAIQEYRKMVFPRTMTISYQLEDFPIAWRSIGGEETWNSLILWGNSGIGKTEFAKALLPKALMVSHVDTLREYNPSVHEGIIFDDMDFKHIPRTAQIHLTDYDNDREIHCRYGNAYIPKNTKKIFTTNEFMGEIFINDPAIDRRIEIRQLEDRE